MRRRSVLVFGAAVVLVLGVAAGIAYALFNVSGTGSGTASVGNLQMTNTDNGSYVVNFAGEYPSYSASGSLTITNTGNVQADPMTLTIGTPTNKTCAQNALGCAVGVGTSADLAGEATITVVDTTTGRTVIASTPIDSAVSHGAYALNSTGGGPTWLVGEFHSFTVTVTVPSGAGNAYQGTSTNFALNFNGTVG